MNYYNAPQRLSPPSLQPLNPNAYLKPPKKHFIILSLAVALLFNMVPLSTTLAPWRIDFVALVLLYWCMWAPRYIGIAISFSIGVVVDVADAAVLGQHAFYYTLLAFGADYLRRRVTNFSMWQQTLYVALLLALCTFLTFCTRMMSGAAIPPYPFFLVPPLSALLWTPLKFVLQRPQRNASDN